jgi:general secretion pathway protein F
MVRAGESSGALDQVLIRLAEFLQAQSRMRNKVGAAMVYPTIMVVVGVGVVAVLITFVVPADHPADEAAAARSCRCRRRS